MSESLAEFLDSLRRQDETNLEAGTHIECEGCDTVIHKDDAYRGRLCEGCDESIE